MDPNWSDAIPPWRQPKTPQSASSGRAATVSAGQLRQWARVPRRADETPTPTASSRSGSAMRSSLSTPGLAAVGLGKFNIGALHEVIKQPDTNNNSTLLEQCDNFFPEGLGVPDSFQGARTDSPFYYKESTTIQCANVYSFDVSTRYCLPIDNRWISDGCRQIPLSAPWSHSTLKRFRLWCNHQQVHFPTEKSHERSRVFPRKYTSRHIPSGTSKI